MTGRLRQDVGALRGFLEARLMEDLARIWARDAVAVDPERRPGMAAQVEVVDDLLRVVRSGGLPERRELRILLHGYGGHPDFDPAWQALLRDWL
ncbi:hypothetical protein [Nocardioides soli]|uniref:Uncharacterized protein n=1 Tax=Nocardioides soli TaxID=1036020 RepID=A0A7W4Z4C8_9ACTN|nr:hypothetical protein [Nocardioides soli]MBB3044600.1 hypothetical protein [Nocardioides soli]